MPPITLPNLYLQAIKSDLVKGYVDITFRSMFTLELMKQRPQLLRLEDQRLTVEIVPPPSLFDQIELSNPQTGQGVTLGTPSPLDP